MPNRIQRKRTRGWCMPENTKYVGRPTKWANPFDWQDYIDYYYGEQAAKQITVDYFRDWLSGNIGLYLATCDKMQSSLSELCGCNLACWCKLGEPCHADVLLELANKE